jgi:2-polyprenyl-3-methyl-5-hydroxy-6-metoxy-1,4-benzoquinol methylase
MDSENQIKKDVNLIDVKSNVRARATWENKAVGSQRSMADKGSIDYFNQIKEYRYGYETPFIPFVFNFNDLNNKKVLEIGVGNGIDAVEMIKNGAKYSGVDITKNHIELTKKNIGYSFKNESESMVKSLYEGDMLETEFPNKFDVVYSFGVLHHIQHEQAYLKKIRWLLNDTGQLRIAVYAKYSFFYYWLLFTWIVRNKMKNSYSDWQSHIAEGSDLGTPVVIKIRSKKEVVNLLETSGFEIFNYSRNGFVQGYIPIIGKYLNPNGSILAFFGRFLGWYHCFICSPKK